MHKTMTILQQFCGTTVWTIMIMVVKHDSNGHRTDWLHLRRCNPQQTLFKSNRLPSLPASKQEGGSQEKHHCMCVHLVRARLMLVRKGYHRQRSLHQCKPCFRCTAAGDVTGDFSTGNGSSAACFVSVTWHKSCSSPRPICAPRAPVRCAASAEDNCTTTVLLLCINQLLCGNDLAYVLQRSHYMALFIGVSLGCCSYPGQWFTASLHDHGRHLHFCSHIHRGRGVGQTCLTFPSCNISLQ